MAKRRGLWDRAWRRVSLTFELKADHSRLLLCCEWLEAEHKEAIRISG